MSINDNHGPAFTFGTQEKKIHKPKKTNLGTILLVGGFALLLVGGGYLYYLKDQEVRTLSNLSGTSEILQYQEILTSVKKLISIPDNETVRVALIDNPDKLKQENATFYANVEAGQYLIIMPSSQKVIIYDKEDNRIVNFSSYTIKVDLIAEETIPASEKPLTIEIRYEQGVSMDTVNNVKSALQKASTNYSIIATTPATLDTYNALTLVLLKREQKPQMSQNIIAHTGTSSIMDTLPTGEASSTADVVLIIANI